MTKYAVDIDQTILFTELKGNKYTVNAKNLELIRIINELYLSGNTIIIQTARHWDKFEDTINQLKNNSVLFHSLVMGNIPADYYINDKGILPEDFINKYNKGDL